MDLENNTTYLQMDDDTNLEMVLTHRSGRASEVVYLIDDISVTDSFSGDVSMEVENNVIQEFTVVGGTFNAEHGRAMSDVADIVTKEDGQEFSGTISAYLRGYLSFDNNVFCVSY